MYTEKITIFSHLTSRRYFVSFILQFQFHQKLCQAAWTYRTSAQMWYLQIKRGWSCFRVCIEFKERLLGVWMKPLYHHDEREVCIEISATLFCLEGKSWRLALQSLGQKCCKRLWALKKWTPAPWWAILSQLLPGCRNRTRKRERRWAGLILIGFHQYQKATLKTSVRTCANYFY